MMFRLAAAAAVAVCLAFPQAARAAENDTLTNIMVPEKGARAARQPERSYEPWLAPTYRSPRSQRQPVIVVPENPAPRRLTTVPPPIIAPQTGRALPNLPGASSGESFQDRAARCAHQSGVYANEINGAAGYVGSCINQ